jgi:hypothetical protein
LSSKGIAVCLWREDGEKVVNVSLRNMKIKIISINVRTLPNFISQRKLKSLSN